MGKPKYEWQEWAVTPDANDLPEDQVRHQIKVRAKGQIGSNRGQIMVLRCSKKAVLFPKKSICMNLWIPVVA